MSVARWTKAALSVLGLAVVGILAGPAEPASAHAGFVSSDPTSGSVLQSEPTQVVLTFTEAVHPVPGRVKVLAPDGTRIDSGDPQPKADQVIIALHSGGGRGSYLVSYRVLSTDSHPIGGAFAFAVGAPSPNGPPGLNGDEGSSDPVIDTVFPIMRWLGFLGLLLLVGSVLMLHLFWPQRLDRRDCVRLGWLGAGLIVVATIGELVVQVPYVSGGFTSVQATDVRTVLASPFGTAHLVRLGVLVAAGFVLRQLMPWSMVLSSSAQAGEPAQLGSPAAGEPAESGEGTSESRSGKPATMVRTAPAPESTWTSDQVVLAILGTIAVATWSVSGHPSATAAPLITVASDMIHIGSMSVWLGGLVVLAALLLPRANPRELSAIVPNWSRLATYTVGALVVTGLIQSVIQVGSFRALGSTGYGQLLIAKVSLVALVLLVASRSRRLVAPIAAKAGASAARLRGIVITEAAVAAVILGVTAVLVQVTPAHTAVNQSAQLGIQSARMQDPLFALTVDITPGATGLNEIHMYASKPDGGPIEVAQWVVRASAPDQGFENISADVLVITPDHAVGQIGVPTRGTWRFAFTLRVSEIDQSTVSTNFTIEQ